MAITIKVLGQSYPTANTATKLYTVPVDTSTVISSIVIANQSTADTFTIAVRVLSAADSNKDKLYKLISINAASTFIATIGITLAGTDEIWVTSVNGTCSFNLFGQEST